MEPRTNYSRLYRRTDKARPLVWPYRCSECGERTPIGDLNDGQGEGPLACRRHPGAPVMRWTKRYEAAANYLLARVRQSNGEVLPDDLEETIIREAKGEPDAKVIVVLGLMLKWGGLGPDLPWEIDATDPGGLFGRRP